MELGNKFSESFVSHFIVIGDKDIIRNLGLWVSFLIPSYLCSIYLFWTKLEFLICTSRIVGVIAPKASMLLKGIKLAIAQRIICFHQTCFLLNVSKL